MSDLPPTIPGYDVLGLLGEGSTARVWRARRRADDLLVAVKVVPVAAGSMSDVLQEAAVLSRVRHQHVLHLYDVLSLPGPDGRPEAVAIAVQLAAGGSLAQVVAARGHLRPGELVTVLGPLAGALSDLHRVGVVHGDLSPTNVLFLSDGMPMLADLGMSRLAGGRTGVSHGTDGMTAPELLEGLPATAESDVYALGALAWWCLVGAVPGWVGTRTSLEEVAPHLPEALRAIVSGCLEPEPDDRPELEEVAVALFAAARPEAVSLAPDADPARGLTHRLRELARADEADRPADGPAGLHPWARRAGHRSGQSVSGWASRWMTRWTSRWSPRRAGIAAGVLILLLAGVAWAGPWLLHTVGRTLASPPGPGPAGTTLSEALPQAAPESLVPTGSATSTPVTVTATAALPTSKSAAATPSPTTQEVPTRPAVTLQRLLDARATAWMSGNPDDLTMAHAAESPALRADRADLRRAARGGVSYRQLSFTVEQAEVLPSSGDDLRLRATVQRSAYVVQDASGAEQAHPSTQRVTVELRRTDTGWRVWSWS